MGRPKKYNTPEEAHEAKLKSARESYKKHYVPVAQRKKWGFCNTVITENMIGKSFKEMKEQYKTEHPRKKKEVEQPVEEKKE